MDELSPWDRIRFARSKLGSRDFSYTEALDAAKQGEVPSADGSAGEIAWSQIKEMGRGVYTDLLGDSGVSR